MTYVSQANNGVITPQSYSNLYNKTFDEVSKTIDASPREGAQFFSERNHNLSTYTEAEVSSILNLPHVNNDVDSIPLLQPGQGYSKTWTKVQYRAGIAVTKQAVEEQKFRMIAQMINGLPNAAMRREEYAYATIFNSGFTSETTADGEYVFDTDHTHADAEGGSYSNKAASGGDLTTDTLEAARLHFDTWTNEKGFIDPQPMTKLVIPPQKWEAAWKVLNSDKYPQNGLNAKNPYMKIVTPVVYHWLTSTTAWFVQGKDSDMDNGFLMVWFTKPEYAPISWSNNPDIILGRRLRMAFAVGALHARNWYGNAGA